MVLGRGKREVDDEGAVGHEILSRNMKAIKTCGKRKVNACIVQERNNKAGSQVELCSTAMAS